MEKRRLIIGTYDTAQQGWTLAEWSFSSPEYQDNYVTVPGRDGALDLSDTLANGTPAYNNRTLTARLELSEGMRLTREEAISTMINQLDGCRVDIVLPDDPGHYISGRVSIAREYNNPAHASVSVTAICDPWRYAKAETIYNLTATTEPQTASLANSGRRRAVPVVKIGGGTVQLTYESSSWSLEPGTYQLPELTLPQGGGTLSYSGSGTVTITYREAVL